MYVRFRKGCYINSEIVVLRNVEFHPRERRVREANLDK